MSEVPSTKEEKERMVIELSKQGMNIRDISKRVHLSFSDIGEITRRVSGDQNGVERIKKFSKHSQALKLFSKGHSNLVVAIELGLSDSETIDEQKQYRRLINADKFCKVYDRVKDELPSFISLYEKLNEEGLKAEEVIEACKYVLQLPLIKSECNTALNELQSINQQKEAAWNELQSINQERATLSLPVRKRRRRIQDDQKFDVFQD